MLVQDRITMPLPGIRSNLRDRRDRLFTAEHRLTADTVSDAERGRRARSTQLIDGTRVRFRSRHEAPPMVELKIRNHLYRIAQEAVQNALKHSGASSIEIELWSRPGDLVLSVTDDGQGLTAEANVRSGLGMRTMRFQASAIGGRLSITLGVNGGNSVVCGVPTKIDFAATA
jgi:signal transduction histidine kinase